MRRSRSVATTNTQYVALQSQLLTLLCIALFSSPNVKFTSCANDETPIRPFTSHEEIISRLS